MAMMPCHCSGLRHCLSFSGGNGSQDPATLDCPTSHSPACNNSSLSVKNGVSTSQQLKTPRYKGCRKIQSTLAVFIHLVGFLSVQCALCENISIHFLQSSPICAGYGRMKPFWKPFFHRRHMLAATAASCKMGRIRSASSRASSMRSERLLGFAGRKSAEQQTRHSSFPTSGRLMEVDGG